MNKIKKLLLILTKHSFSWIEFAFGLFAAMVYESERQMLYPAIIIVGGFTLSTFIHNKLNREKNESK